MSPGPVSNPPNRWLHEEIDWEDRPPTAFLEVREEVARTALQENKSPDLGFRWSVNPYRGCSHACAYCYARPTHEYLGFGAGTDFERRIVVKTNLPSVLRAELRKHRTAGERVVFSGNTDCYQPLEASWKLTRKCLQTCAEALNPVGIVTKGTLIERDIDVLQELTRNAGAQVFVSVPILNRDVARAIEPGAPSPQRRLSTLSSLSAAGITTGLMMAPLIPGVNDHEIPSLLREARESGATRASMTMLRLPGSVLSVFEQRLRAAMPLRANRILSAVREMRGGRANESEFGKRMRGLGARWKCIADLFEQQATRQHLAVGFSRRHERGEVADRGLRVAQLSLFKD